ncbi:MAG: hypothetical protein EXR86_08280 [Gammaproteobacteria bacterium]|nr:hypothetical protein [Gammaproteobacteria bacterium]
MPFDKQGEPVWATDLVIADRIVAPILQTHARDITLWRFHRRAAADAAGHQFSLLVFTQPMVYAAIQQAIEVSPAVESLKASGHLREIRHDCQRAGQANGIAATIDQQWDPVLQRAWPYFIMGVSASWLAMVQELALGIEANSTELIDAYRSVDAQITKLWGLQGQHAFLHHLNGIYGYRPLSIQHWMQF